MEMVGVITFFNKIFLQTITIPRIAFFFSFCSNFLALNWICVKLLCCFKKIRQYKSSDKNNFNSFLDLFSLLFLFLGSTNIFATADFTTTKNT